MLHSKWEMQLLLKILYGRTKIIGVLHLLLVHILLVLLGRMQTLSSLIRRTFSKRAYPVGAEAVAFWWDEWLWKCLLCSSTGSDLEGKLVRREETQALANRAEIKLILLLWVFSHSVTLCGWIVGVGAISLSLTPSRLLLPLHSTSSRILLPHFVSKPQFIMEYGEDKFVGETA